MPQAHTFCSVTNRSNISNDSRLLALLLEKKKVFQWLLDISITILLELEKL